MRSFKIVLTLSGQTWTALSSGGSNCFNCLTFLNRRFVQRRVKSARWSLFATQSPILRNQRKKKFRTLVQNEFGSLRRFRRPAEFLATPWVKDTSITYFDRYAAVLETVTPLVTG